MLGLGLHQYCGMLRLHCSDILGVDVQDTSSTPKALIPASKVDSSDAVLAQHRSAHDARLDSDIEICLIEDLDGILGENASNGNELGVSSAIQGAIGLIHAATNNLAIFDKDTADGCFVAL
jgi:hypothetical protein